MATYTQAKIETKQFYLNLHANLSSTKLYLLSSVSTSTLYFIYLLFSRGFNSLDFGFLDVFTCLFAVSLMHWDSFHDRAQKEWRRTDGDGNSACLWMWFVGLVVLTLVALGAGVIIMQRKGVKRIVGKRMLGYLRIMWFVSLGMGVCVEVVNAKYWSLLWGWGDV